MPLPTYYAAGTASVANGDTTVTFSGALLGTIADQNIMAGDLFLDPAQPAIPPQRIASIDYGAGTAELSAEWPGASMSDAPYEVRYVGMLERSTAQNRRYLELAGQLKALGIQPNAFGEFADREVYDDERKGFIFLSLDGDGDENTAWRLYAKLSADSADWDAGQTVEGAEGPPGPSALAGVWRGAYSGATAYAKNDIVLYQGSSWIALQATTGNAPPTLPTTADAYWELTAAAGTDGAPGNDGAPGSDGEDGVGVPAGGSAGQVLAKASGDDHDTEWVDQTGGGGSGEPLVILATGQSNLVQELTLAWSPDPKAQRWQWPGIGQTGASFAALPSDKMNYSFRMASEIARATGRRVYLIKIANSGRSISHWLPGTGAPDLYADCKNNVEAALSALGRDKIDMLLWWQGESDAAVPSSYVADFETVIDRFKDEDWFPASTPILVQGITSAAVSGTGYYGEFNSHLQLCVSRDPERRTFSYTPGIVPAALWSDSLHMTAAGHDLLGAVNAEGLLYGFKRPTVPFIYNPETDRYGFGGQVPASYPWEFARDSANPQTLIVANNAEETASQAIIAVSSALGGLLRLIAYGASAQNIGELILSTGQTLLITVSHASGNIRFRTGGTAERLRIRPDGAVSHRNNAQVVIDENSHLQLRSYTVGSLPSASTAGQLIYVSNGGSNKRLAVSDGTNWRWPDGAIVS